MLLQRNATHGPTKLQYQCYMAENPLQKPTPNANTLIAMHYTFAMP